jgi:hypothetical protein
MRAGFGIIVIIINFVGEFVGEFVIFKVGGIIGVVSRV